MNLGVPVKKLVAIVDFDNTLFDWVHVWHASFSAMMQSVCSQTKLSLEDLASEIREVHQRHGTSEYAFLLGEIPSLKAYIGQNMAEEVFADAIRAYRTARKRNLYLYPSVADSLLRIKGSGARIAIYTESQSFYSFYRLKRLGLDGVVDCIYSPPDHDLPEGFVRGKARHYTRDYYQFRHTQHRHTPRGELKPNPAILKQIINDFGVSIKEVVYVGDSRHKDVAMALDAGVDHAWAAYGESQETEAYEMLKMFTHWTDEDVSREAEVRARMVEAKVILKESFSQLFDHFKFGQYGA